MDFVSSRIDIDTKKNRIMETTRTPTQLRMELARQFSGAGGRGDDGDDNEVGIGYFKSDDFLSTNNNNIKNDLFNYSFKQLEIDVCEIFKYRNRCDPINRTTLEKWFPNLTNYDDIFNWIDCDRDFIYNAHGLRVLMNRYMRKNEPIQYCMLRIAKLFSHHGPTTDNSCCLLLDYDTWHLFYDIISCGFLHTSSILADADQADESILPGEACRLMVTCKSYDRKFIKQMEKVCTLISLGVGVGLGASTIPLRGYNENGKIRDGFVSVTKKLDSCNYLSVYERKPKIAMYISIHNDTIYEAFNLKSPLKQHHLENIFIGLLIPDYFMTCLKNKTYWYLFPGDATLDDDGNGNGGGANLSDFSGKEYEMMYERFVTAGLYTKKVKATALMESIIESLATSGTPYIIFDDHVNRFSNHQHLGKIKTLNLCAEITNYSDAVNSSSCTLMSVNCAMYRDFVDISRRRIYNSKYLQNDIGFTKTCDQFQYPDLARFAFMLGYMGTMALNNFMGPKRERREIGINPCGIFDMAVLANLEPTKVCAEVSEAMYMGAIHASHKYFLETGSMCVNYPNSPFSQGRPQWCLRDVKPTVDWTHTLNIMTKGMANSMLTAQAPTATTSLLVGTTESATLPMSLVIAKESENGRNGIIVYGLLAKILNNEQIILNNDLEKQVLMYAVSAPFIDHSQSTMYSLELNKQKIFDLIIAAYRAKLKTAIYYILPKQQNPTLSTVRKLNSTSAIQYIDRGSKNDVSDGAATAPVANKNECLRNSVVNGCDSCSL